MTAIPDAIEGILDASALLALLLDEPGADLVEEAVAQGVVVGAVNFAEVLQKLKIRGLTLPAKSVVQQIAVLPFDEMQAHMLAGLESPHARKLGLSFADLACLSLGIQLKAPVLTADRTWLQAQFSVKIKLIR